MYYSSFDSAGFARRMALGEGDEREDKMREYEGWRRADRSEKSVKYSTSSSRSRERSEFRLLETFGHLAALTQSFSLWRTRVLPLTLFTCLRCSGIPEPGANLAGPPLRHTQTGNREDASGNAEAYKLVVSHKIYSIMYCKK